MRNVVCGFVCKYVCTFGREIKQDKSSLLKTRQVKYKSVRESKSRNKSKGETRIRVRYRQKSSMKDNIDGGVNEE